VESKTKEQHVSSCLKIMWTITFLTLRSKFILRSFQEARFSPFYYRFRAQVDRGDIVIGADEWPTFLYNEERYDYNREWIGLFLGETFVRVSPSYPLIIFDHSQYP